MRLSAAVMRLLVAVLAVILSGANAPAIDYSTVAGTSLATASPVVVSKQSLTLDRSTGADYVSIAKPTCPSGRTPDLVVSIKSLLSLAVIGGTEYFDPWASVVVQPVETATDYRIYVAVKTVNNNILGCDPTCTTCAYCDACPSVGVTTDPTADCTDHLAAELEVTLLCR